MSAASVPRPVVAARPSRVRSVDVGRIAALGFAAAVFAFLYAPILVMAMFSFNDATVQALPLRGFTTRWYAGLVEDRSIVDALFYSLRVSGTAVLIASIAGTGFAILFTRARVRGARILQALIALPFVLPGMVLGIALLLAFRELGIAPGFLTVVTAHVVFITPVIMFVVAQRLNALDPSLEQAAMDLGAGPLRMFTTVLLPSIRTALISGALLAFTVSFDEVIVTFFVSGSDQTLPVHIWTLLRLGFSPSVNAILTIIALASVALVTFATLRLARTRAGIGGKAAK
jgi:spermidine/putrescine transport system permease protein